MTKSHNIAWASGFFEGEGYVGFKYTLNKMWDKSYPRFVISISQVSREPLDKFKEIFGAGTVRGPYGPYQQTKQEYYQYQISGDAAVEVLEKLLPYLFAKGAQAKWTLMNYEEYLNGR